RSLKICFCFSSTAVTRGSMGRPPRSRLQATRTPLNFLLSDLAKTEPGSEIDSGARRSGPAIADNRNAVSSTVRAIGPSTPIMFQAFGAGHEGTRPGDGRKPTTLQ